ncbi:hypothetical protein TNCV_3201161 [Trichonephila clavipes]|nr:hypothetical protein TNCV_3201161 [Trichonephila clavipes]
MRAIDDGLRNFKPPVTWTAPELAPSLLNFHTTLSGGRLSLDIFNVHWPPTRRGSKRKEKRSFRLAALLVGGSRCLSTVQHDASQQGKAPFPNVLTSTVGDFTCAKNADTHYMHDCSNGNGRAVLRMYHAQFPDRRMPHHRIFSGCIVSFVKHVRSTSPDLMLVDEEQSKSGRKHLVRCG